MAKFIVQLLWDPEANVWTATSESIAGLVLESGSLDALIERVRFAVPELLLLNGITEKSFELAFQLERIEQVSL
ncbi:MAG: DUF1902 domain-containing protein [Planctomycetes bacterium]|nr:DUF1902 domain-containing protein [Planctomycetota bacterium]